MRCGLIGQSYAPLAATDLQETINAIPTPDESEGGRSPFLLEPTPGLNLFAACGAGPHRGGIGLNTGRAFQVSGAALYEISYGGVATNRGALSNATGTCTVHWNGDYLFLVEAPITGGGASGKAWSYRLSTNTLTNVTASLISEPLMGFQLDGYFGVVLNNSAKFQISALLDPTSWDPLMFAATSIISDQTVACYVLDRLLFLFGSYQSAIYWNSGNADFPLVPINNGMIDFGCVARDSICELDGQLLWLGISHNGRGQVLKSQGTGNPQRVSTRAIERTMTAYSNTHATGSESLASAFAWTYEEDGRQFYVLTYRTDAESLVLDLSTGMWHKRAKWDGATFTAHLGRTHVYAQDRHLLGSRVDGKLYEMSLAYTDDAGADVKRLRRSAYIAKENRWLFFSELRVPVDTQTGRTITLRKTTDGGATWSTARNCTATAASAARGGQEAYWNMLGRAKSCAFEISVIDVAGNTKATTIIDGYVEAS